MLADGRLVTKMRIDEKERANGEKFNPTANKRMQSMGKDHVHPNTILPCQTARINDPRS